MSQVERDLAEWVDKWSARYGGHNPDLFRELGGHGDFNASELARIVEWKNKGLWPAWKVSAIERFEKRRPGRVREITSLALRSDDPELAIHILTLLPGVKARTASAMLTVHDPVRFTIMDRNALKALQNEPLLGVREKIASATSDLPGGDAWWRSLYADWLRICHELVLLGAVVLSGQWMRR